MRYARFGPGTHRPVLSGPSASTGRWALKITVKVALDVDVEAWEEEYRTEGAWDTGVDVEAYVRELIAGSRPAELRLWRAIEHPSGWVAQRRSPA